jgi:hypothetical protein
MPVPHCPLADGVWGGGAYIAVLRHKVVLFGITGVTLDIHDMVAGVDAELLCATATLIPRRIHNVSVVGSGGEQPTLPAMGAASPEACIIASTTEPALHLFDIAGVPLYSCLGLVACRAPTCLCSLICVECGLRIACSRVRS